MRCKTITAPGNFCRPTHSVLKPAVNLRDVVLSDKYTHCNVSTIDPFNITSLSECYQSNLVCH